MILGGSLTEFSIYKTKLNLTDGIHVLTKILVYITE